jgi:hypothetical protein
MPQDCLEQSQPPHPCGLAPTVGALGDAGAVADDCKDAGGRATQEQLPRTQSFNIDFLRVLRVLCGEKPFQPDFENTLIVSGAWKR